MSHVRYDVPNYYDILGVSPEATLDDIKRSFRHLALKHHPDKNKNSEESRQKFMVIVEAYEVLSDEQSRRTYDGSSRMQGSAPKWTPPADIGRVYSYEEIKRKYAYTRHDFRGGMWDISDRTSIGLWKATMILFACLGAVVLYILLAG